MRWRLALLALPAMLAIGSEAKAQAVSPVPERDVPWQTVTGVTLAAGATLQVLMPRVFYADPEVTVGWKGRWHVSALAPAMTLTALAALNELALKGALQGRRPGCDASNDGLPGCDTYGQLSTHAFGSFAALGHGGAVFLFDTLKWSDGRFNGWGFAGNVGVPFALGMVTAVGRSLGNWESGGQILLGGVAGLTLGFLSGMTYSLMQRPECGYTGSLICW
jgi:hypothetical protein